MEPEASRDIRGGKRGMHDVVSTTTRVGVDYLLVGMAATTETDGGEMSLARAAGAGNRVGQCQGAGWASGRARRARPATATCARAAPGFPAPGRGRGCR